MWLRDTVAANFQQLSVWTYGYESNLADNRTVGEFSEYASTFGLSFRYLHEALKTHAKLPIIFIAHSLGGLLLKEMIIELSRMDNEIVQSVAAILFFGVPTQGMNTSALETIVGDNPSRYNLTLLDNNLGHRRRHEDHSKFCSVFPSQQSKVFQFYETKATPSVLKDPVTGIWTICQSQDL
jgi:hypothetical protein